MVKAIYGVPLVRILQYNVLFPNRCRDRGHIRGPTCQNFQDQLDEIDAKIERFDGGKELGSQNRVCRGNGVGDRIEKLVGGLTNFALQYDVGSTPSIILGELCSLKCPREVSSEELGLANDSTKKQALVVKTQSVEANVQPPPTVMKILAWNCRGLRNRRAIQELVNIVQAQDPMIVFLSETWSSKEHMKWVRDRILFDGYFMVSNDERGVGISSFMEIKGGCVGR